MSYSVKAVLAAMHQRERRRIACISNAGAAGCGLSFVNRIEVPVFLCYLKPLVEDRNQVAATLRTSEVDQGPARLVRINDIPAKPLRVSAN